MMDNEIVVTCLVEKYHYLLSFELNKYFILT